MLANYARIVFLLMLLVAGCTPTAANKPISPTATQMSPTRTPVPPATITTTAPPTAIPRPPTQTPPPVVIPTLTPENADIEVSPPQRLSGHSSGLGSLAFSSDGTLLASTGEDRTIRLWNVGSGQQKQVWQGGSSSMKGLDFSPDGHLLASIEQDSTIALWDVSAGQVVRRIDDTGLSACGVEFSPDGTLLASGHEGGMVRLWEVESGKLVRELGGLEALSCPVAFSPDGSRIAAGGGEKDIRVMVWEVSSGELLQNIAVYGGELPQILPGQSLYVYRIAFSPGGTLLASASGDRKMRLWEADSGKLRYTLIANREKLSAVDFSPDGKFLVSGGIDGSVRLWDVDSGQQLTLLPSHNGEIYSVVFSPVDWVFASAGEDDEILLWRMTPPSLKEFSTFLESLAAADQFSGAVLVAQNNEILLEKAYGLAKRSPDIPNRVDTKFNLGSMNKMFTAVAILQLMEQGKLSLDNTIIELLPDYPNREVAKQVTIHHLLTHTSGLGDVFTEKFAENPNQYRSNADYLPLFVNEPLQFKPGDQFSYSNAGFVVLGLIIERVSGQPYDDYIQKHILEPSGMINTGAFAIDANTPNLAIGYTTRDFEGNEIDTLTDNSSMMPGKGFAAGGWYSTVEDLFHFREVLLGHKLLSQASTDLLLTGKVQIRTNSRYAYGFFDRVVAGQRVVGHGGGAPGICSSLSIYPETGYTVVILSNSDEGCLRVLNYLEAKPLPSPTPAQTPPTATPTPALSNVPSVAISVDTAAQVERWYTFSGHSNKVITVAFSGKGPYIASSSLDKTVKLWNVVNRQEVYTLPINKAGFNDIAFSPDGRLLASADAIWDVESGQMVHTLEQNRQDPGPVAFSPDGATLAVALEGRPIKVWDVASGQVLHTFDEQPDPVIYSIAFSPNGAQLATGTTGGIVRLWDVASGQIAGILKRDNESGDVHDVAFSPDGSLLAAGGTDTTVQLWDVASMQVVHTLRHGNGLYSVAFSPDGTLVASAGCDRTVKLWDVESGKMLRSLLHADEVMAVAFSSDGTLLASGSYDNQVYLWSILH